MTERAENRNRTSDKMTDAECINLVTTALSYCGPENLDGFSRDVAAATEIRGGCWTMTIEDVSKILGFSVAEISEKLSNEKMSFKIIRSSVRFHLAMKHIVLGTSIEDMSIALAYPQRKSFDKAFKEWTGLPPGKFRKYYSLYKLTRGSNAKLLTEMVNTA